eukprot:Nk52_evm14s281 gene=Nk52_evmTU14s281
MPRVDECIRDCLERDENFFSFEYFPPKTEEGLANLYERIERMGNLGPLFIDVTWGAGGSSEKSSFDIALNSQDMLGLKSVLHLTCSHSSLDYLRGVLDKARDLGIRNILALRGDKPTSASRSNRKKESSEGLSSALDLVKFIRENYGDFFCIGVAAYPEGHPEANSYHEDLEYLKKKIDAGANFVISQFCYDVDIFLHFFKDCKELGIDVPIVAGLMPISNYHTFNRICSLAKVQIPPEICDHVYENRNNDALVKEYGIKVLSDIVLKLRSSGIKGFHFYTMNLEKSVVMILAEAGLVSWGKNGGARKTTLSPKGKRDYPWIQLPSSRSSVAGQTKDSPSKLREKEDVRPIFWYNRPASYCSRTAFWDEFPNGRWGDSRSPAYGEMLTHYLDDINPKDMKMTPFCPSPRKESDIYSVFVRFLRGEVDRLPWFDSSLAPESGPIKDLLIALNSNGLLTINSQPCVNGIDSSDPVYGWGPSHGRVYQKAYIEFFISPQRLESLKKKLDDLNASEGYQRFTYDSLNIDGKRMTNDGGVDSSNTPNAVTWGIFPSREVIQPTVVDPVSFVVWKDEAFQLWKIHWLNWYKEGGAPFVLLSEMIKSYYLVNIVDNDFFESNLFEMLAQWASEGL